MKKTHLPATWTALLVTALILLNSCAPGAPSSALGTSVAATVVSQSETLSAPTMVPEVPQHSGTLKWEYRVLWVDGGSAELAGRVGELNQIGADGWELVGLTGVSGARLTLVFKRPIGN